MTFAMERREGLPNDARPHFERLGQAPQQVAVEEPRKANEIDGFFEGREPAGHIPLNPPHGIAPSVGRVQSRVELAIPRIQVCGPFEGLGEHVESPNLPSARSQ